MTSSCFTGWAWQPMRMLAALMFWGAIGGHNAAWRVRRTVERYRARRGAETLDKGIPF